MRGIENRREATKTANRNEEEARCTNMCFVELNGWMDGPLEIGPYTDLGNLTSGVKLSLNFAFVLCLFLSPVYHVMVLRSLRFFSFLGVLLSCSPLLWLLIVLPSLPAC